MHATPFEVAITQTTHRTIAPGSAATPPMKLSAEYIKKHIGDRHGPPNRHREQFPDGRVRSHSALASPKNGRTLMGAAITVLANDYLNLLGSSMNAGD